MISWIQRTFQQHFKWLFLALLVVVIISFVFVTNTSSGLGQAGERRLPPRPFFGIDLSQAEDSRQLGQDAQLSIFLRFAPQREVPQAQVSQYALNRHASLALAAQLGLPEPTEEQLIAHIRTLAAFANPATGQFDPKRYAEFTDGLRTNPQMSEADVSRVIAEDARIVAYEALLAGPGYVTPADVAELIAQRDTTWSLAIASIDGTAFAPAVDTSDAALQTWFDANARRYEIASRVSVAAVEIASAPLAAGVTLSDAAIRAAYDANPAAYPAPDALKDADSDAKFAAVRSAVEAALRKERANDAALAAASDLAVELLEKSIKPGDVAAFLAGKPSVTLTELGAVGAGAIPAALGGAAASSAILAETERLAADRPYSNPVVTPAGAALLVWRETIPAHVPSLAEVRAQALADYQTAEKRRLFNEAGRTLQATVASALAAPGAAKPFADLVTASAPAGIKVELKTPKPFSLSGQFPEDMDYTALQALQTLAKGKVSDFLPAGENRGVLVYAIDQQIPTIDRASPAYTELRSQLATNLSRSNAQAIITALVEAELAKTAPAVE
jgi:peptidyl-prolyl cis-trans isomerase D